MKKSSFRYFLSVLVATMLSCGGAAIRAQQTQQPDSSDTSTTDSKSKSKSKTKDSAGDSTQASASTAAPVSKSAPKPTTQPQAAAASVAHTVWVNTDSGIYHKPGTKWYGKTKQGKYMTEADAKKAGYRPAEKE
jgi:cytoskeletal protein RodZ